MECRKLNNYDFENWGLNSEKKNRKINKKSNDKTYFKILGKRFYIMNNKLEMYRKIGIVTGSIGITVLFYVAMCVTIAAWG